MTDKAYLIDGSGYIFRAYYAVAPLSTSEGLPTNALFGFTRMLLKLLSDCADCPVVMVFDSGSKTFRNELYPEYKANRAECPDDLRVQMPYFRDISSALGLPILELEGFEADDVIATLARRLEQAGIETVVVSADKDLMQLVGAHISQWDSMRDRRYGPAEVEEKFGVPPEQVVEFLALAGDSSDNIPGLKGVGPKTAVQLIKKFGDVSSILRSADVIREDKEIRSRKKISERIESDAELVRLSRRLVEVRSDAPVVIRDGNSNGGARKGKEELVQLSELEDGDLLSVLGRRAYDADRLGSLIEKLEFQSLLRDFPIETNQDSALDCFGARYITIWKEDFEPWLREFEKQTEFAFDLETTSLHVLEARVVGMAFCWGKEQSYYIPVAHSEASLSSQGISPASQLSFDFVISKVLPRFGEPSVRVRGQNLKYDLSVLLAQGYRVDAKVFDTMVAAYLLSPEAGRYGLDYLAKTHLGVKMVSYQEVTSGSGKNQELETFADVPIDRAAHYAAEDAHVTWLLAEKFREKLAEGYLEKVAYDIEMPLIPVLSSMEVKGVKLDVDFLSVMSEELGSELESLTDQIHKIAGFDFNVNSPKQLAEVMFDRLGISTKGVKKTKTGYSTNSNVLEMLENEHPLPRLVLRYRTLHKLKSTYVDALPAQLSPKTGRLHSRFNQTVTATGRLSSSDPNLQNIPIQTQEGRRIRRAFIADPGRVLVSADYSQIELRLLAHMSGDANMIKAFLDGNDIHASTAREILEIPDSEELGAEDRRLGKTINFGIIYGMSGFRLGRDLGIPVGEATHFIDNYFAKYPRVREFFDSIEKQVESGEAVTTLFGRKRYLAEIHSRGRDSGFVRRAAMNAPLQGTAADIIKLAMVRIHQRIVQEKLPFEILLQIHDELVFVCDEDFLPNAMEIIRSDMENVVELEVPLVVDMGSGRTWEEAH